jgi:hypothetical protein
VNAIASPAPMTAEEARASAHVSIVRAGGVPFIGPRRQWPSDVPDAAHAPRGEVESRPALDALGCPESPAPPLSTWEEQVPPTACDPSPSVVGCGITSFVVPRDPPGMSHRVPPPPVEVVTVFQADLFSDLARCRDALDRMSRRVVSRERAPARAAAPLPVVPDLVPGIEAPDLGPVDDYLPGRGEAVAWDDLHPTPE